MTAYELYRTGRDILRNWGIQSADFDAIEIFNFCCGMNRQSLIINKDLVVSQIEEDRFLDCINKRGSGMPLQYILGMWSFMGLNFKVGKGVLIPRDDTEVLVREAMSLINCKTNPRILDLCSGSGAIAISLAKSFPHSEVVAVEFSSKAYFYLCENVKLNKIENLRCVRADVLCDYNNTDLGKFDLIVSNPPYIPSDDIENLQPEVHFEPRIALDGGKDGLVFYECILKNWKTHLNHDGHVAVEIGIGQSNSVAGIFGKNGFCNIKIKKDINEIDRVVLGKIN